ncbi:MAG: hypothetical protein K6F84_05780, partial [Lachnospiraceae bacterium]|nr:hypothetical protein [Lachnospiraceae bacterium]
YKIQHAGVAMLKTGPSHKLLTHSDIRPVYHGVNRLTRNVLMVTGACLMVRKDKCKGKYMDESFPVAYNDVELCLRLHRQGYENILVNEAVLYHHESLSRGRDILDDAKKRRLEGELERLYKAFPEYVGKDPYYSPNLIDNAPGYDVNYKYPWGSVNILSEALAEPKSDSKTSKLMGHIDECFVHPAPGPNENDTLVIRGWAFNKNESEEKYVVLSRDDRNYYFKGFDQYRGDLSAVIKSDKRTDLAGFFVRIDQSKLASGTYRLGFITGSGDSFTKPVYSDVTVDIP